MAVSNTGAVTLVLLVSSLLLLLSVQTGAQADAIECEQVYEALNPCLNYIITPSKTVPKPCCDGIQGLLNKAKTTADRRTVCNCLKNAATKAGSSIDLSPVASIPAKCQVSIPFKISTKVDCSKVN
ncbi:hypothetical protein J5N97_017461 [Dioscorea zingiberensis]|uniref:Non-specific lipid-transfer protein n=1 Tax=Dioscorea zingiberensis TaxID=325984 RepID=A0A9D5HG59_9LILI|nr:hypothetical protein J5N97_017461 [Dioscorea zingiberensis]